MKYKCNKDTQHIIRLNALQHIEKIVKSIIIEVLIKRSETMLPLRNVLPVEETWNIQLLFDTQADYEKAVNQLKALVTSFNEHYEGKLTTAAHVIAALNELETIELLKSRVFHYASLPYSVDKTDKINEENVLRLNQIGDFVAEKLAFFESELLELSETLLDEVVHSEEGEVYRYYIEALRRFKPHMKSKEVEYVLTTLSSALHTHEDLYETWKFQDLTFNNFEANNQTFANSFVGFEGEYECHQDREIRHQSWKAFHADLKRYMYTAASNYINYVETQKKLAKLRGFDSTIDYLLFDQNVSPEAYHRQIDVIMAEFAPVMRRYAALLAQEQNLDTISLADIKMPFSKEAAEEITIEESRAMIEKGLSVLGKEYQAIVKQAFDERWIDYPMNQTKSTGGFCATVAQGPSYILLNWTGLLSEVLVLAHELGHAGHFNLTYKHQKAITPEASLYFIEAPSTANEVIMCQYLLNQPIATEQKRQLIGEFISRTYFHNMVTHLLEAHWQRKVYQAIDRDEVLNADMLNQFFKETLEAFWGEDVIINDGAELTWMRQPHYFGGLYSYTYSAGLTIGTAIGQKIAAQDQEAIDKWLNVLKAGGTHNPVELAEMADVSMRDAQSLRSAIQYVDSLLDQLEAK